jgi:hypothetical protein
VTLRSTQPLPEMSARNLPAGTRRRARKAENLTAICELTVQKNVGASKSHNPMGLHGLLEIALIFLLISKNAFSL